MQPAPQRPPALPRPWLAFAQLAWIALLLLSVYVLVAATLIDPSFASLLGWSQEAYRAAAAGLGVSTPVLDILYQVIASITRLSYLALGILLYFRRKDEPITLFISIFLITFSVTVVFVGNTAQNHLLVKDPLFLVRAIGQLLLIPLCFIFPDGRWVPRWSKWPTLVATGVMLAYRFESVRSLPWMLALSIPALIWWLAGVPALIYRYRRMASPEQRQQIKWGVFGISGFLMLSFVFWTIFGVWLPETLPALQEQSPAALGYQLGYGLIASVAQLLLPVSFAIAILRYRLWDIDVIIRKTLVYAGLTISLGLAYFGSVVVLQNIFQVFSWQHQSPVATVISTLFIAAIFSSLRRRIQSDIDRRFYRRKYDAEQALASFSDLSRQEVDLEEISARLLAVVRETVQPETASIWLRPASRARIPGEDLV